MQFRAAWVLAVPEFTRRIAAASAALIADGERNQFSNLADDRFLVPESITVDAAKLAEGSHSDALPWPELFAVIPWASHSRWTEPAAVNVSGTLGGVCVQKSSAGFAMRNLSIAGDIGPLPYKAAQAMDAMANQALSGQKPGAGAGDDQGLILPPAYRALLQAIYVTNEVASDPGKVLHLYSIDEGRYYIVETLSRALIRGMPNRNGWHYEFHFKALGEIEPPVVYAYRQVLPNTGKADNWLTKTVDFIDQAIAVANDYADQIEEWGDRVDRETAKVADYGRAMARLFQDAANLINDAAHYPARVVSIVEGIGGAFNEGWMTLRDTFAPSASGADPDYAPGDDVSPLPGAGALEATQVRELATRLDQMDSLYCRAVAAARLYAMDARTATQSRPILPGDTLQGISIDLFGVPDFWEMLARLNDLSYPYISDGGQPGTLRPGQKLKLPDTARGASGSLALPWVPEDERLFGRGIRLTDEGDWAMAADGLGADYVAGLDCVRQGLRVRLDMEQGANPLSPTMGLPAVIGDESKPGQGYAYALAAMWQLRRDDRIAAVRDYQPNDAGNVLGFRATAVLVNNETVRV